MSPRPHAAIAVLWLLNPNDQTMLHGGMERYCRDVALLLAKHGFEVRIFQKSTVPFIREIAAHVTVEGLPADVRFRGNWAFGRQLARRVQPGTPLIFVSQELAISGDFPTAIAVNHGIWWDGDVAWWKRWLNKRLQARLIRRMAATICVDTNYINWCHAEIGHRSQWRHTLRYIPNYADLELFPVQPLRPVTSARYTLLFPRRTGTTLADCGRGTGLMLDAFQRLRQLGDDPTLIFAGRGGLQPAIQEWAAVHQATDRIRMVEVPLDQMPALYAECDVVVVPTTAHEGTSLSAIEGIVSGRPTVVTHIGGLCNIAINGLTAHVADVSPESVAAAIRRAVVSTTNGTIRDLLPHIRAALGKPRWEAQVWELMCEVFPACRAIATT